MERLSGDELESFEEHLLGCESCLDRVEELERFIGVLAAAADDSCGAANPGKMPRF